MPSIGCFWVTPILRNPGAARISLHKKGYGFYGSNRKLVPLCSPPPHIKQNCFSWMFIPPSMPRIRISRIPSNNPSPNLCLTHRPIATHDKTYCYPIECANHNIINHGLFTQFYHSVSYTTPNKKSNREFTTYFWNLHIKLE